MLPGLRQLLSVASETDTCVFNMERFHRKIENTVHYSMMEMHVKFSWINMGSLSGPGTTQSFYVQSKMYIHLYTSLMQSNFNAALKIQCFVGLFYMCEKNSNSS